MFSKVLLNRLIRCTVPVSTVREDWDGFVYSRYYDPVRDSWTNPSPGNPVPGGGPQREGGSSSLIPYGHKTHTEQLADYLREKSQDPKIKKLGQADVDFNIMYTETPQGTTMSKIAMCVKKENPNWFTYSLPSHTKIHDILPHLESLKRNYRL